MTARQAGLLGLLAMLWGASYLLIKYALEDFSPGFVVFARTLLGAVVLYAIIRAQNGPARTRLGDVRDRPGTAALLGLLAIAAPFLLIAFGELEVPSGLTAVLIASAPLWVAMFAPFADPTERVAGRQAAGLVLGLAGVALLVGVETIHSLWEFLGAVAIVGAAAFYSLASFLVKRGYRDVPALTTSFISIAAGCLLTLPLAVATPPTGAPGMRAVLAVVVLGVAGTAFAFVIFYRLIAELGAARSSLVSYLIPPLSLAYGALLLDETITAAAVAGLVLIFAGVALASSRPRPAPV
ncbi:MAG TPA: DMT family transporter [Solirubrobacteraceae bacterium]|nr:DMT family transporter [Solirubrobacteraceae bacterium]